MSAETSSSTKRSREDKPGIGQISRKSTNENMSWCVDLGNKIRISLSVLQNFRICPLVVEMNFFVGIYSYSLVSLRTLIINWSVAIRLPFFEKA